MMQVNVKLYGMLRLKYSDYDYKKGIDVELNEAGTIENVLSILALNPDEVSFILVNGRRTEKSTDFLLKDQDVIEIISSCICGG